MLIGSEMEGQLIKNLAYTSPGGKDKVNALIAVLVWRNILNCPKKVQKEFCKDTLAKIRNRLSKLIMWTEEPGLEMILNDNILDIVNVVSQIMYEKFGSAKRLIWAALDCKNHIFDSCLIKGLEIHLGLKKKEFMYSADYASRKTMHNTVFCALLFRNVLNSSKKAARSLPSGVYPNLLERLSQMIRFYLKKNPYPTKRPRKQPMGWVAKRISEDIFNKFGEIKKFFNAALETSESFDVLLLEYLQTRFQIEETPGTLNRIVTNINSGLERITRGFYKLHTRWPFDSLPTIVHR